MLDGSRVSCMLGDKNQSSRQGVNIAETGSTTFNSRESPVINTLGQTVNGSDTRNNSKQCVSNVGISDANVPSSHETNEMQIDEPCSPSIITTPVVAEQSTSASAETSADNRSQSRGRSATRKAEARQKRAQSAFSRVRERRSLTQGKSKKNDLKVKQHQAQVLQADVPNSQPVQDKSPPPDDESLQPTQSPDDDNSSLL